MYTHIYNAWCSRKVNFVFHLWSIISCQHSLTAGGRYRVERASCHSSSLLQVLTREEKGRFGSLAPCSHRRNDSAPSKGAPVAENHAPGGSEGVRRGRRVSLPEEFLRVPGWSGGSSSSDPQVTADARLAMMLQVRGLHVDL